MQQGAEFPPVREGEPELLFFPRMLRGKKKAGKIPTQAINVFFVLTGAGLGSLRAAQGFSMQVFGVLVSPRCFPCGKRLICTFPEFLTTMALGIFPS